jgi:amidase
VAEEWWRKSASELAQLIADREVSSREVVDSHFARIDAVNPVVNAVVELLSDEARVAADAADAAVARGDALGRLHGVPYTVKCNIDYTGSATSECVVALKDLIATTDAPMVKRMRAAGAIAIGRTNMPDFGLRINTESELYGSTHNPWDLSRTAGGSSGGEAAAIASGMSPVGIGNDIGGSVRNPAYCCGIASIKPSFGRVAAGNDTSTVWPHLNSQLMLAQGPLARTVADVRLALECVMGSDPRDPHAVDAPLGGPSRPKRAALIPEPVGGFTDADVAEGVRIAGRALENAGYEVEEISPPELLDAYVSWSELMTSSLSIARPLIEPWMGQDGRTFLDFTTFEFPPATPESLAFMHQTRYRVARGFQQFFAQYPVIVGPTWTQKPFALGWDIESRENAAQVMEMFRFVLPANLMGLPAACVPTGVAGGLPTGVQVIGPRFREDLCLDAAAAIEASVGVLTPIDPRGE